MAYIAVHQHTSIQDEHPHCPIAVKTICFTASPRVVITCHRHYMGVQVLDQRTLSLIVINATLFTVFDNRLQTEFDSLVTSRIVQKLASPSQSLHCVIDRIVSIKAAAMFKVENQDVKSILKTPSHTKVVNPTCKKVKFAPRELIVEPPIWNLAADCADKTKVLSRHPPYSLTAQDFLSLRGQNWLTDTVIDSYLTLFAPQNTLHLSTQTMTAISEGISSNMFITANGKENIKRSQRIVGSYNLRGNYWVGVIICMRSFEIKYFDPISQSCLEGEALTKCWSFYFYLCMHYLFMKLNCVR
ncbi:hypothetical protein CAPTEDRAFT_217984 [Capitella teleta]|uniref:Ubiquitin-like protease family profile domain-containing protein n=1 Tax=Capitella teleta TaxID=283909 RepID=R7T5E4_CAPTE|nr:hypothetical protein CAPTEDRAFT_217984 [Capitella teleta]|eukprot:ELT88221.1 hypothetical protein CAPTEDRAFT_217984 [Capitella teleta]